MFCQQMVMQLMTVVVAVTAAAAAISVVIKITSKPWQNACL